jgi:hypothetical protein
VPDAPPKIDLDRETHDLLACIKQGDPRASVHLARLFVADDKGALQPFAEVLSARLSDHLSRCAEIGVTNSWTALEDEVYGLMQAASIDWAKIPGFGERGDD